MAPANTWLSRGSTINPAWPQLSLYKRLGVILIKGQNQYGEGDLKNYWSIRLWSPSNSSAIYPTNPHSGHSGPHIKP